jgi:D-alanine-D-alanine ligase
MMDLPYVGSGVTASAVSMDKVLFKTVMKGLGIPVVPSLTVYKGETPPPFSQVQALLESEILFIKPSFMGSSVGISKVSCQESFEKALAEAFHYGEVVLVEKAIQGRELECALLGNGPYKITEICEIIPKHDFYSYEAKYLDPQGAAFDYAPALRPEQKSLIKRLAHQAAQGVGCQGLARVDFFATDTDVYVNEINTLPGFTSISMYPQLWINQGIAIQDLISHLLDLAEAVHEQKKGRKLRP